MIISCINNKGGVGKTTSVISIAARLAELGFRVLVVDLDGQMSATESLGFSNDDNSHPSVLQVLTDQVRLTDAIVSTRIERLDLVPSSMDMASLDVIIASQYSREHLLARALESATGVYDLVLLDCPPGFGLGNVNALVAADALLVPVEPHFMALKGLRNLMTILARVRAQMRIDVPILGVLLTKVDWRNRHTQEAVRQVQDAFGDLVMSDVIRINTRLVEAPSYAQSIHEYAPESTGAAGYRRVTDELIERIKHWKRAAA